MGGRGRFPRRWATGIPVVVAAVCWLGAAMTADPASGLVSMTIEAQDSEAESSRVRVSKTQSPAPQSPATQTPDTQSPDAQGRNAQDPNAQDPDAQHPEGQASETPDSSAATPKTRIAPVEAAPFVSASAPDGAEDARTPGPLGTSSPNVSPSAAPRDATPSLAPPQPGGSKGSPSAAASGLSPGSGARFYVGPGGIATTTPSAEQIESLDRQISSWAARARSSASESPLRFVTTEDGVVGVHLGGRFLHSLTWLCVPTSQLDTPTETGGERAEVGSCIWQSTHSSSPAPLPSEPPAQ